MDTVKQKIKVIQAIIKALENYKKWFVTGWEVDFEISQYKKELREMKEELELLRKQEAGY